MIVLIPYINLLKLSWIIKCLFLRNMESLNFNIVGMAVDETQQSLYEDQLKVLNMTELIWSLCEILWIDTAPGIVN